MKVHVGWLAGWLLEYAEQFVCLACQQRNSVNLWN